MQHGQLQKSIIEQNADFDWSAIVTWHQWEKTELDLEQRELMVKNDQANKNEKKDWRKKKYDRVRYSGKLSELLTLFTMLMHRLSIHCLTLTGRLISTKCVNEIYEMVIFS